MDIDQRNRELEAKYSYESKDNIRRIIRNYDGLKTDASHGCDVAMCIRADIELALNFERAGTPYRRMTKRQAQCLYHHVVLGMTQDDVAATLGITQPAVSKYVGVALAKLYVLLLEPCVEEQERRWDELCEAYKNAISRESNYFGSI